MGAVRLAAFYRAHWESTLQVLSFTAAGQLQRRVRRRCSKRRGPRGRLNGGNEVERGMVEQYVGGVGKGYLGANGALASAKQPGLFCYDGDYTTGQLRDLLVAEMTEFLKRRPDATDQPVEMLLLYRLKRLHPCS